MGNLFSCCHPGRKEEEPGGSKTDRLLQDSSTQTGVCAAEEETHGSTLDQPKGRGQSEETSGILIEKQQSGTTRGTTRSSSSSSGGSSSGSHPAEPAAMIGSAPHLQAVPGSAPACKAARAAPTGAQGSALPAPATSSGYGGAERGVGGMSARGFPTGPSTGANGAAGAGAALALVHRSGGAMPRAHPNDQRWAGGGGAAHPGDIRLSGRGAVQKYGGAGAVARGGRFGGVGVGVGAAAAGSGFAGRTGARAVPAAAGTVLAKYEMKEVLGVGSTSKCYRCINRRSKKQFACKVIDKRAMDPKLKPLLDQFHVEIQVLQLLRHPNIIHMEDVFESDAKIHMVMEIMQGGELFDYVVEKGTLSESEASVMVRKVTSALAYMHSLNIIHRDLKPENLLLTSKGANPEVKIIDFGLAKVMGAGDDSAQSFLGTRGYLAPEMLQRESYNKEVDVWALGVIVFVLLCGCLPFDDDSKKLNQAGAFKKFVLRFPRWADKLSPGAKDLLSKLLTVTPRARLTAKQALEHSWVTGKAAAADNFLESPRTLRKLRVNSPKKGWGSKGGGAEANGAPRQAAAAAAAEAHRRAEFEAQSDDFHVVTRGQGREETDEEVAERSRARSVSIKMWHALGALAGSALLTVTSCGALEVVTPALSQVVIADRTYTVEWTGTSSDNRFEIDLFYCGSYCVEDDCGEWVTALCPYAEDGCPDSEGDYDVVMPEPMVGTSGSGYKVRVVDVEDPEEAADCSDEFYLMMSEEAPQVGDVDGPYLIVTAPEAGDSADAGEVYTVEFDYDNGVGSRVDRFKIDLYAPGGNTGGDCGTWITNLCDKESIGCKDSTGDYDVEIPDTVTGGRYVIRVGRFEDDSLYGCSAVFEISGSGGNGGGASGEGSASSGGDGGGAEGEGEGSSSSGSGVGTGSGSAVSSGSDSAVSGGDGGVTSSNSGEASVGGSDQGEGTGDSGEDGSIGGSASSGSGSASAGGSGEEQGTGTGDGGGGETGRATSSASGEASASSSVEESDGVGEGGGGGGGSVGENSGDDSGGSDTDTDNDIDSDGSDSDNDSNDSDSDSSDSSDSDSDSDIWNDTDFSLSYSYSYSYDFGSDDDPFPFP
eukprot:g13043.t1